MDAPTKQTPPGKPGGVDSPTWPEWPLLPPDAIETAKSALDRTAWDPAVLNGFRPLGEGPIPAFEAAFSQRLDVPFAVALSSGAAALHAALIAADVRPGDEVIISPYSWPQALVFLDALDAVPVFCDVTAETLCLNPASVEERITDKTRAVIVEHTAGCPAAVDHIVGIAARHGTTVIEDCAAALGAQRRGRAVGTIGDIGCFSLGPRKHLPCGEGGVIVTRDSRIYEKTLATCQHPDRAAFLSSSVISAPGFFWPYRMHPIGAVLGLALIPHLEAWHQERARNHERLRDRLRDRSGCVRLVEAEPGDEHAWGSLLLHVNLMESNIGLQGRPSIRLRSGPVHTPLHQRGVVLDRWGDQLACPIAEARCNSQEWMIADTIGWVTNQGELISRIDAGLTAILDESHHSGNNLLFQATEILDRAICGSGIASDSLVNDGDIIVLDDRSR